MHYVRPPLKKIFDPNNITKILHTEDNLYEVQAAKCTKTLYQTDTIRPAVLLYCCTDVHCTAVKLYSTAVELYYYTSVMMYCCTAVMLYRCTAVLLYNFTAALRNVCLCAGLQETPTFQPSLQDPCP